MKHLRRASILGIAAIVAATFCAVSVAMIRAYLTRRNAEQFLTVLEGIQVGTTNRTILEEQTRRFRRYRSTEVGVSPSELEFVFENHGLALLHIAPYTEFRILVRLRDEVVVEKQALEFQASSGCGLKVVEKLRGLDFKGGVAPSDYPNHIVESPPLNYSGIVKRIAIENDNTYEENRRLADWSFNLSCLTRLGGCGDARMMFTNVYPAPTAPSVSEEQPKSSP